MRLLALGAGEMGEVAAVTASSFPEIHELVVADLNLDNARKVAARCHGKAVAQQVDVTQHDALVELMQQADVAMNCVGPFFRFGPPILRAAIAARKPYCDICDDPEPTLEMLRMNAEARQAGSMAVIGIGASPGITNLLARMAYESLDTVDELVTAWNIETSDGEPPLAFSAAIVHWMQQISGTVLEWQDGRLQNVAPLREELLHYPGRGTRVVWTVGHPEPIALSLSYPGLKKSYCAMVASSLQAGELGRLQSAITHGGMTLEQAAHELVQFAQQDSWLARAAATVRGWFDGPRMPAFFAVANGVKDGRPGLAAASMRACAKDAAEATAVPLALIARLFAQRKLVTPGVYSPEAVIDPRQFFDLFHPYCCSPKPVARMDLVEVRLRCGPAMVASCPRKELAASEA